MINQVFLNECFDYQNGLLRWKTRPEYHFKTKRGCNSFNTQFSGKEAGRCHNRGYLQIGVSGHRVLSHRVIWIMFYGLIPEGLEIDHINHNKRDNRIENLRLVSHKQNGKNLTLSKNNKSGFTGVIKSKFASWQVYISNEGKKIHVGSFRYKSNAILARKLAELQYNFHANHGASK